MNPWWLKPPGEDGPAKENKADKPAKKTEGTEKPDRPESRDKAPKAKEAGKKDPSSSRRSGRGRGSRRRRGSASKARPRSPETRRIVVFYDVAGTDPDIDLKLVARWIAGKGQIVAQRAYVDQQSKATAKKDLDDEDWEIVVSQGAISSPGRTAINLALDAVDLATSGAPCEIFALVSGNGDFSPLVAKLQQSEIEVYGFGVSGTGSADLVSACDQYLYGEDLLPPTATPPVLDGVDKEKKPAFVVLVETIQALEAASEATIWGSTLKREIRKRQPGFEESSFGYATFTDLLEDAERHEVIQLERDDRSGGYYVAGIVSK